MIFGSYETFKFENSLIGAVYPTSPFGGKNDDDVKDDTETIADNQKYMVSLMRTIAERGKYWYNYSEYECIWFLSTFCCCFFRRAKWYKDRLKRLERHNEASQKLADEIDIVKLLYV